MLGEALAAYERGVGLLHQEPDHALEAFRQARDTFQAVVDGGTENGKLYYNLGNAHLRLAEIGKAIANYRRAQRLIPGDPQLRNNLAFARSLCRDKIPVSGERTFVQTVFFLHYSLPLRTRMTIALMVYGFFWLLMIVRLLTRRVRLGYLTLVSLVVWAGLGVSIALSGLKGEGWTEGVLIAKDVVVRKGNGESYDAQFAQPLHEGVEFTVIEERGSWVHIELPDGNRGWVRDRQVAFF